MVKTGLDLDLRMVLFISLGSYALYIPLMIHLHERLRKKRNELILKKRYTFIVLLMIKLTILNTISLAAIILYSVVPRDTWYVLAFTYWCPFGLYWSHWLLCWRYWLIYYSLNLGIEQSNEKWKSIINPISEKEKNEYSWFRRHKKTFGSLKYGFNKLLILSVVQFLWDGMCWSMYAFGYFPMQVAMINSLCGYGFIWACIYFTYYKIHKIAFYERLFVKQELFVQLFTEGIPIVSMFIHMTLRCFNVLSDTEGLIFFVIDVHLWCICKTCGIYVMTQWVLDKVLPLQTKAMKPSSMSRISSNDTNTRSTVSVEVPSSTGNALELPTLSLQDSDGQRSCTISASSSAEEVQASIRSQVGFQEFMNHLNQEFCTECLLAFTEFTLFERKLYQLGLVTEKDWRSCKYQISLPNGVPTSAIVCEELSAVLDQMGDDISSSVCQEVRDHFVKNDSLEVTPLMEMQVRAYLLYHRYVREDSRYEINISFDRRRALTEVFESLEAVLSSGDDMDGKALLDLFQPEREEMFDLMDFSFSRFKFDPASNYDQLSQQHLSQVTIET